MKPGRPAKFSTPSDALAEPDLPNRGYYLQPLKLPLDARDPSGSASKGKTGPARRRFAENYERRVAIATNPLDAFYYQLVGELDDQNGGFTWWAGYFSGDWKTRILLSDYLIQSVDGVSDALPFASFAARTHREMAFASSEKAKQALREGRLPFTQDANERRRYLMITQSAEACRHASSTSARHSTDLDGCFWHGCPDHHAVAVTNAKFWSDKVRQTIARDRDTDDRLTEAGWISLRIWEHEDPLDAARRVHDVVTRRRM